ncbi:dihydrolipoamide acetyltransferase family protein [Streptomyces sp. Li-HN-5-11]|uniref:dihydrolipoamide acetyltransferase family protein n=1 Tax=Streptomyces sp. Li-HN-5-11 TaxID=3075432 RepID=UPI0028AA64DE|nr:dihydrolipoamide acetyltransferase family protein [Streptomyces sp. Li-HN-5-11]WNM36505.1 dihydrolipoamide acetyltransferase family protein [Streptomyces sp. Li-HN-5-11]
MRRLLPAATGRPVRRAAPAPATGGRTFHLPDLGEGLADAEVLEWKVSVGDTVAHDQVVVEVETAKSVVTLPSPFAGTVTRLHCGAGEVVAVGAPLLTVSDSVCDDGSGAVLTGYGTSGTRRTVTMPSGRPAGTGPGDAGGVGHTARDPGAAPAGGTPASRPGTRVPLDATAEKYLRGHRETPAVTIWADTDATALLAARASLGTGLLPLLAQACLTGLAAFPELNARVDTDRGEIVRLPQVHLGFAVQTDRGLVVPVVRDADRLSPEDLAAELRSLTGLARRGALPAHQRTGGTFTLNNYGVLGVDGATPLLNHPQAAMLGVGRITDRPWAVQGRLETRKVVHLSLTFDHRVCDGGTAAGFLRHVVEQVTGFTPSVPCGSPPAIRGDEAAGRAPQ